MIIQTVARYELNYNGQLFVTAGNGAYADAPDWIRLDPYFEILAESGLLDEFTAPDNPGGVFHPVIKGRGRPAKVPEPMD